MSACFSVATIDGAPGGGGGGGGVDPTLINLELVTTDDTATFVQLADLPNPGDSASVHFFVQGTLIDVGVEGQAGMGIYLWQIANTSANGTFGNLFGVIPMSGYTDPVFAPWSTVGAIPAGWGGVVNDVNIGTAHGIQIIGAIATTIRWNITGQRNLGGTATP